MALAAMLLYGTIAGAAVNLEGVKNLSDANTVKVIINMSGAAEFKTFTLSDPARLVIDLSAAGIELAKIDETIKDDVLKGIRTGAPATDTVRVVLDLAYLLPYEISKHEGGPSLLVRLPRKVDSKKKSTEVLPGVVYTAAFEMTDAGPMAYHALDIDLNDPRVSVAMCIGEDRLGGLETLTKMAKRKNAAIGINGGYFSMETGSPIDLLIFKGKALLLPDRFRGFFGIDVKGKPVFMRPNAELGVRAAGNKSYYVHRLNMQPKPGEMAVFTPEYGKSTGTPAGRREVVVRKDKIAAIGDGNSRIPDDGYVLSADNSHAEFLAPLEAGMDMKLLLSSYPDIREIAYGVSAGPTLVREGEVQTSLIEDFTITSPIVATRNPRTAAGVTNNNHLIFLVVEGRSTRSVGMTLTELGRLMKRLGAVEAVNLDGGGSSEMVIGDKIVNKLPDDSERRLANGFLVHYLKK